MDKKILLGLLGTSKLAARYAIFDPIKYRSDIIVAGVASRDNDRSGQYARKHAINKVYDSYDALIADPDLDAVYVPLPNHMHYEWTMKALASGKHVLCEKPLASNAEQASKMQQFAVQSGLILMEGLHFPYHPLLSHMRDHILSGILGELQSIDVRFCLRLGRDNMRFRRELAGGATMDVGCYAIELMRFLTNSEPVVVSAQARLISDQVDEDMQAMLQFPNGVFGTMHCSLRSMPWDFRLLIQVRGSKGEMKVINPFLPHLFNFMRIRSTAGRKAWHCFPKGMSSYWHQLEAFSLAIRNGLAPLTDGENGIRNMLVIDEIYRKAGLLPRDG